MLKRLIHIGIGALLLAAVAGVGSVYWSETQLRIVQSGSMEPAIGTGAIVAIQPAEQYAVDDVVTFHLQGRPDTFVTHRIIAADRTGATTQFTTKGDANPAADTQTITDDQVVGRVVATLPLLGFVFAFVQQPLGFALLVGIPALLVIWNEVRKILRTRREQADVAAEQKKEASEHNNTV
jgi:signal peptidase